MMRILLIQSDLSGRKCLGKIVAVLRIRSYQYTNTVQIELVLK